MDKEYKMGDAVLSRTTKEKALGAKFNMGLLLQKVNKFYG